MMNHHHMPAGQGHQQYPSGPQMHPHHARAPRDFHPYHVAPPSPMQQYPYHSAYQPHPQQFYPPQPYPHQVRWQQQQQQQQQQPQSPSPYANQQYMPPPHSPVFNMPYQQRSPMVVSSQPLYNPQPPTQNVRYPGNQQFHPQAAMYYPNTINTPVSPSHLSSNGQPKSTRVETSTKEATTSSTSDAPSTTVKSTDVKPVSSMDSPSTSQGHAANADGERDQTTPSPLEASPVLKTPFYPELPWYTPCTSASNFPKRDLTQRRRRSTLVPSNNPVTLPSRSPPTTTTPPPSSTPDQTKQSKATDDVGSEVSTLAAPSDAETPATSHAPSETECTNVSMPTTPAQLPDSSPKPTPTQPPRRDPRAVVAVPFIPGLPRHKGAPTTVERSSPGLHSPVETTVATTAATTAAASASAVGEEPGDELEQDVPAPIKAAPPKTWADLVRKKDTASTSMSLASSSSGTQAVRENATLAEALRQYVVQISPVTFFEPRGLVNTGNMCYMNSILQVLVFCVPFYDFLDQVRSRTVHSIKSDTPLLDAMIMFMRDLPVLSTAQNAEVLRRTLKPEQLEKYGDPITPEYIYDAIKHLPRFQSMRRGHQQDAEEFLGFVLEGLHDECLAVMQSDDRILAHSSNELPTRTDAAEVNGWLEVGPKQKAAVTRTAGQQDAPSPVTKIFGGHLRSELRVSGHKDSVTLEPYKPLQLDIGAPNIHNIIDAIRSITRSENLTGDFGGRANTAKKQVFIDSLPPVLILHLKRFQYENNLTGTQKIWKKIGYPLELEIPKDVFSPTKRAALTIGGGLPKYRLTAVVYHHGKSAAGGHYTVDVLRQDFQEWVRIDDTVIRRIRAADVAEGGAEEDPKVLARALEQHKATQDLQKQRNMYEGLDDGDQPEEQARPWNEVNGHGNGDKKSQSAAAVPAATVSSPASTAGKRTPNARKEGVRDNKVAYILLYERIAI